MVEGSRIDHAAHSNDAIGHLHGKFLWRKRRRLSADQRELILRPFSALLLPDILAWNDAVAALMEWVDADESGETVLIGSADHECGGLVAGGQVRLLPLLNPRASDSMLTSCSHLIFTYYSTRARPSTDGPRPRSRERSTRRRTWPRRSPPTRETTSRATSTTQSSPLTESWTPTPPRYVLRSLL